MIYFAPIQGFTDYIYRNVHAKHFNSVDKYFMPYIQTKNVSILPKYIKDVASTNNLEISMVPQLLAANVDEYKLLADLIQKYHYSEINLNLGCPYPMVYKRGKGSGLLPNPSKVEKLLDFHYQTYKTSLSVKIRSGLNDKKDVFNLIEILNSYPLIEVIYHPRTAKQLYKGNIDYDLFQIVQKELNHPLVFNGEIKNRADALKITNNISKNNNLMIGRGLLTNPFLAEEIVTQKNRFDIGRFYAFHNELLEKYIKNMDNEGNALNKMQQHWTYWGERFPTKRKYLKQLKKCKKIEVYTFAVANILN